MGTMLYLCLFKRKRSTLELIQAIIQLILSVFSYIPFGILLASDPGLNKSRFITFIIFAVLTLIAYIWGIVFGALLLKRNSRQENLKVHQYGNFNMQ
jgi:hypothetical protein